MKRLDDAGQIELYSLDEPGVCLIRCIPYGWQPGGETLERASQRSNRLNVLAVMNRRNQLESYISKQSLTTSLVITGIDSCFAKVEKPTVIGVDPAPIHSSDAMMDKLEEWQQRQIEIFQLPSYSPELNELNRIEILWRLIKSDWIEISAYQSWQSLVEYVERVLREFGKSYVINFG